MILNPYQKITMQVKIQDHPLLQVTVLSKWLLGK